MASLPVIADRVAFLLDGRIHFTGPPADFATSPDPAITAFLLRHTGDVAPFLPPDSNHRVTP